ncbi:MAG: tRNA pseudouridine(55) synthase TruB [Clostridia bacterium]|nr:tRNA pseudouridine(55) synthase TruB [Clostridia bacterium]
MKKREPKIKTFGFFNVDKPSGTVSSAVVNKLKWLTGAPCGHMGTLDPLASGVLPVGVGNATRLFDYFLEKKKEYIAEFTFGVSSDTLDSTGELVFGGRIPSAEEIVQTLPSLCGEVLQMPPKYSAKNIGGKRGYELARAGIEFELQPKRVRIDEMELLEQTEEKTFRIRIVCGGGTYIRSIGRDLAESLGTNAVMSSLRRVQSGAFTLANALPFSFFLNEELSIEELESKIIPTESVLPYPTLCLNGEGWERVYNGVAVKADESDGLYKFFNADGSFYGIAEVKQGLAKLKTKLC